MQNILKRWRAVPGEAGGVPNSDLPSVVAVHVEAEINRLEWKIGVVPNPDRRGYLAAVWFGDPIQWRFYAWGLDEDIAYCEAFVSALEARYWDGLASGR